MFNFVLGYSVALLPILAKVFAQVFDGGWHRPLASHTQIGGCTGGADVEIFVEKLWMQRGELVNAYKENRLKFKTLDVLDVKHSYVAFLSDSLSLTTCNHLDVVLS